jgi:heterodisulfide reductase subunit C
MPKGAGIVERSLVQDDHILEHDNLVLDGIDVSGRWNTMLKSRVHADRDLDAWDTVRQNLVATSIDNCIQCGMCTAGCTVAHEVEGFNPRQFIYWVRTGRTEELKNQADVVWRCVGCYICTHHCPKEVNTAEVIETIGQWLRAVVPERMDTAFHANHKVYRNQLGSRGRLSLPLLQTAFLRALGRQNELFSPEMKKTALKMVGDGRAFKTLLMGRPRRWRKNRRVLDSQA